VLFLLFWKAY